MTSVTSKTSYDPAAQFEDGVSVPGDAKCTTAPAPKATEAAEPKNGDVDTFEIVKTDPRRAELERINAERKALRKELDEKGSEAKWAVAKLFPFGGTAADVVRAAIANGPDKDAKNEDAAKSVAQEAGGKLIETGIEHTNLAGLEGGIGIVSVLKDAYDFTTSMVDYGKAVKKDEELKRRAEVIEMGLDPNKKFELVKIGGEKFYRQDGKLVSDKKLAPATQAQKELCDRLEKGK